MTEYREIIEAAWEDRANLSPATGGEVREAVEATMAQLDRGRLRVAEKQAGDWQVNTWAKKAVLLYFRLSPMRRMNGGVRTTAGDESGWFDKVPMKFAGWGEPEFRAAGFRAVPDCRVRYSAFIAPDVVMMPCFVNVGAYVDTGTMVDTWATVGSCAQIGRNVHISGGAGIGGVLEPLQAAPVILEDNCFIGARAEVAEGVRVEEGAVLAMGGCLGAATPGGDRATGGIFRGRVPAYAVVVPGTLPGKPLPDGQPGPNLYCAVIVKRVDAKTRSRVSINELLREGS